jgi:kinetochore protein Mis12/MTW1
MNGGGAAANGNGAPFAFLTHTPAAQMLGIQTLPQPSSTTAESRNPLTTHTTFTASQLPYLKQLLASLQPHLPTTALPTSTNASSTVAEQSRERKIYLESQSKRILEKRGVDTRDGVEGVWEGRKMGGEEVRGLENVVGTLGRGRSEEGIAGDTRAGTREGGGREGGEGDEMDTT